MSRRIICLFLSCILICISYAGCRKKGISKITIVPIRQREQSVDLQYKSINVNQITAPYSVKQDLSDISNKSVLDSLESFDRYMLAKKLFIIKKTPEVYEQPFNIYEKNNIEGIPGFITVDSIVHAYHIIYNYTIRNIEKERLINELKAFTGGVMEQSIRIYNGITEKDVKEAALKNVAYFGVAMKLLEMDLPGGIPLEANRMIDNDTKRIRMRWNSGTSEIFPYYIDYKKYTTKGYYSRDNEYRNYFLTMMWYGNTPLMFDLYDTSEGVSKRMDEQIAMAVIMSSGILNDESLRTLWEDIYDLSCSYMGRGGDVNVYDLSDIIKVIYGENINLNKIWESAKLQKVYELAKQRYNLHAWEVLGGRVSLSDGNKKQQVQFRLMGQMYNIDYDIYNNLTSTADKARRMLPNGLDLPSAFGCEEASKILNEQADDNNPWTGYESTMQKLKGIMSGISGDNPADYSFNNMIFWVMKPYLNKNNEGYPSFMSDANWNNKKLITYLGAICDTKRLSSITAKSGEVKSPDGVKNLEEGELPGYVETEPELYGRLEYTARTLQEVLLSNKLSDNKAHEALAGFINTVVFLKDVSVKELKGFPLTAKDKERIKNYDIELKNIIMGAVDGKDDKKQWENVPQADRNMASITDAYQNDNQLLQTAIGNPDYLYVIVQNGDKKYIARGSVYSYYESSGPSSRKLNDREWQSMLYNSKELHQPLWIKKVRY